jgi:hypothetical protein
VSSALHRVVTSDSTVRVVPWEAALLDQVGVDPRSLYVELFWLPVLGPTATWLLRRLADGLDIAPHGFTLDVEEMARSIGLGGSASRHTPLARAIERAARFSLLRQPRPGLLAVRRAVGPLPERHLRRLPGALQNQHARFTTARSLDPADERRHAFHLAFDLTEMGDDPRRVERRLTSWGLHPALAYEAAAWAATRRAQLAPAAAPLRKAPV